jgi:hypothetical protein
MRRGFFALVLLVGTAAAFGLSSVLRPRVTEPAHRRVFCPALATVAADLARLPARQRHDEHERMLRFDRTHSVPRYEASPAVCPVS